MCTPGCGRSPPWPAPACDTLGFWCPLRSGDLPAPSEILTLFFLALPCSDICFKQFSLTSSFPMKSAPEEELVGRQYHGQTQLQQKLGKIKTKGPLYHLNGILSLSPYNHCYAVHLKFFLQYKPFSCLLPWSVSSSSPHTLYMPLALGSV